MMKYGTRNLLELSFSGVFSIQVLVHLTASDVAWFNSDFEKHNSQLLSLISKDILPSACREEIESYYERRRRKIGSDAGKKEVKIKRRSKATATSNDKTSNKTSSSLKHFTKKKTKETQVEKKSEVRSYVDSMDTKWYFSDSIQIACQIKPIRTSHRASLIFSSHKESNTEKRQRSLSSFKSFKPIPKIISIWCYPFENDPKSPSFSGFPRTELIPLSAVFKES